MIRAAVVFDVPDGRLEFGRGDLDLWAEHLAWCFRMMDVPEAATIAVQDFGTSPLSFLGSALLMPHLERGLAEHLGGRFICLDASLERVTLTPTILAQLAVDVLVVRAEVMQPLSEAAHRAGKDLTSAPPRTVVTFRDDEMMRLPLVPWRFLLTIESAMLLAPECGDCRCFHLREGFYAVEGDRIRNLRLPSAGIHSLSGAELLSAGGCVRGPDDWRVKYRLRPEGT
jgi:hypothetical protein